MTSKEDSSFLQELDSRLDSLFGEDTKPIKEKDSVAPQSEIETSEMETATVSIKTEDTLEMEDSRNITIDQETDMEMEASAGEPPAQAQSTAAEIDRRFSEIFGDGDKTLRAGQENEKPEEIIVSEQDGQHESSGAVFPPEKISPSAAPVEHASIDTLKSIVLSLEWEINDRILQQLEDELNLLYLSYADNRIIQGLLRIIRFVGRYLRMRGESSDQDSINLLLSVYDHLENVMASKWMTDDEKRQFLIESIRHYRYWVERADLESPAGSPTPETPADEIMHLEMESPEYRTKTETTFETAPLPEMEPELKEEEPSFPEVAGEQRAAEPEQTDTIELAEKEQEAPAETQPVSEMETPEDRFQETRREEAPSFLEVAGEQRAAEPEQTDTIELAEKEQEAPAETQPVSEMETPEDRFQETRREEAPSFPEVAGEQRAAEPEQTDTIELAEKEQEAPAETQPVYIDEDVDRTLEAIKNLPPHEAFAYALEELKKTFQAEIDALKKEIRLLKNNR
jgi:hypothetical protein